MFCINGRFLLQPQTGVNRFAYELCKAMLALKMDFVLLCPFGEIKDCYDVSKFRIIRFGWGKSHFWEQFILPFAFWKIRGEKILINFTGIGPVLVKRKIMTIHDLAFMVNSGWYSSSYVWVYRILTPLSVNTSMKVLTVSEFSKNEIVRLLALDKDKISVIYNAVSPLFQQECDFDGDKKSKERYILAVSSIDPRKNFSTLLKAFSLLEDSDVKLYIIGNQNRIYATSVEELGKGVSSERINWLGRVTDIELRDYYRNAVCFVYPSLYEGFGIPPLEAMACGTPTIVSDIPPLREVCGEAALFVNPLDEKDIADKIYMVLKDSKLRKSLREKGYKRYEMFDWRKSAYTLGNVIRTL